MHLTQADSLPNLAALASICPAILEANLGLALQTPAASLSLRGSADLRSTDSSGSVTSCGDPGHKGEVHHVAMNHTGQTFASAAADQTVRLWSNSAQGESRVMKVHSGAVRSVCFSRDDSTLLTASDDKTIKLSEVPGGPMGKPTMGSRPRWGVYSADFSKNSELVASAGEVPWERQELP
eukprot:Skav206371  [mRNA]  locus=scaffold834:71380:79005:+ [translate_table: standard]